MIWLVGTLVRMGEEGVVIDAGEYGRRCNIYVRDRERMVVGVKTGERVKIGAVPRWVKEGDAFSLKFDVVRFETK